MNIRVKYFSPLAKLEQIENGDWIDLKTIEDANLYRGKFYLIPLGVAMELPRGYEANIVPRSSTFSRFGILQVNCFGVIDSSYRGDDDQWFFPAYATRNAFIPAGSRICQFRINRTMRESFGPIQFDEVECLGNQNRGGHGSTGA